MTSKTDKRWSELAFSFARKSGIDIDAEQARLTLKKQMEASAEEMEEFRLRVNSAFTPTERQAAFLASEAFEVLFGGAAGGGKASCIAPIWYNGVMYEVQISTPFGMKPFSQVKVGDQVSNPDGTVARVIQVHPRGIRPIYRVETVDGAATFVDAEHLWLVNLSGKHQKSEKRVVDENGDLTTPITARVMDTLELKKWVDQAIQNQEEGKRPNWPLLPLTEPVQFTVASRNADARWPVHPYLLGVLLGDGAISGGTVEWCKPEPEIVDRIKGLGYEVAARNDGKSFSIPDDGATRDALKKLGIWGKTAEGKFIPPAYLTAPLEVRWALAQGLFDTDGYADDRGHIEYSTVSEQLAKDVQWLVRSLGFKATLTEKETTYSHNGEKRRGQKAYILYVAGNYNPDLFSLSRKKERCKYGVNGGEVAKRRVVKVEYVTDAEAMCITVDHPNHLYITDDFIVTHNSHAAIGLALQRSLLPGHTSILFRKTYPQINGSDGLAQKSLSMYPQAGGQYNGGSLTWTFPLTGSAVQFRHMSDSSAYLNYQGLAFQCVAEGTKVRMWDDSLKPVEDIRVGDKVMTLEGPCLVERTFPSRIEDCLEVTVRDAQGRELGKQYQPASHYFLTPDAWVSAHDTSGASLRAEIYAATQSRDVRTSSEPSALPFRDASQTPGGQSEGQAPLGEAAAPVQGHQDWSETFSVSAIPESDFGASDDAPQEAPQPLAWSVPVVRYVPSPLSGAQGLSPYDGREYGRNGWSTQDSQGDCPPDSRCGGEQAPPGQGSAQETVPSRGGAEQPCQRHLRRDEQEDTPAHSPADLTWYAHPYTMEARPVCVSVEIGEAELRQAGKMRVFDLQIAACRNYITETGLINRNCVVFDELTQFGEFEYLYLISRARSSNPAVVPIIRATANPGGPGHDWVLNRWRPWLDPNHPNPAAPGEVRWYLRRGEEEEEVPEGTQYAKSRTFIPSLLTDNPYLMQDEEYMGSLMSLPEKEREQLLKGNWTIKISAGMYFKRQSFVVVGQIPEGDRYVRVRYWDRAATEPNQLNKDPDWTVGAMVAYSLTTGVFYIEDIKRFRLGPGDTMNEVITTMRQDVIRYPLAAQVLEIDPGQAGKVEQSIYEEKTKGLTVFYNRVRTNKEERAKNFASLAQDGRVAVLDREWRNDLMNELEDFPLGRHDDMVDAISGCFNWLSSQRPVTEEDYFI